MQIPCWNRCDLVWVDVIRFWFHFANIQSFFPVKSHIKWWCHDLKDRFCYLSHSSFFYIKLLFRIIGSGIGNYHKNMEKHEKKYWKIWGIAGLKRNFGTKFDWKRMWQSQVAQINQFAGSDLNSVGLEIPTAQPGQFQLMVSIWPLYHDNIEWGLDFPYSGYIHVY